MPIPGHQVDIKSDVQPVKADRKDRIWRKHHVKRHRPSVHRRIVRKHDAWPRYHVWRGHRGYRHHRPGYRLYNGFWYPPAAFSLGIVIKPGHRRNAHIRWCRNHYISYRVSDDTFQPYHGPRRKCVSP